MSSDSAAQGVNIIALPVFGAVLGYLLKYYLDKKQQLASGNIQDKREMYQKFVDLTISFFITTKESDKLKTNTIDEIYAFYKKYILYASPQVITAFSELMQFFYKRGDNSAVLTKAETKKLLYMMTDVYKAMRKDIGLSNSLLGIHGEKLMRGILKDYDEVLG